MSTLYASDLDGTLLQGDETISEYTAKQINSMVQQGMIFSYATARSLITARKVTQGLDARLPVIVYNGAFVMDSVTGERMLSNFFDETVNAVLTDLFDNGVYPIIYAFVDGVERFSFIEKRCTRGMRTFLDSRRGDRRTNPVRDEHELIQGELFYLTCIDEPEKLEPIYIKYSGLFHCIYHRELYTRDQWLEILPQNASKANAARKLKKLLGCDRLVAFGDGKNDVDLFEAADEGYAVNNAVDELKAVATAVIGGNNEDGVARWLAEHAIMQQ